MNLLLIDNSNIFIGVKDIVTSEGRFDYDKFVKNYTDNTNQKKILVGSTPPKSDSFWSTMRNKGFEVFTYERKKSGEKAVDSKIIVEGVEFIVEQPDSAILNLMSGDLDMFPLVEKAIQRGWEVIIWSWKESLNQEYLNGELGELITVNYLDDIAEELIYFNLDNDGYIEKEYLKDREIRLEKERLEQEFNLRKQNIKREISQLHHISNKDVYLNKIDEIVAFEQITEINNILNEARVTDDKLKKEAEEKAVKQKRQQEERGRQIKEAKKQARKEFWDKNKGKLVGGLVTLAGSLVLLAKKTK